MWMVSLVFMGKFKPTALKLNASESEITEGRAGSSLIIQLTNCWKDLGDVQLCDVNQAHARVDGVLRSESDRIGRFRKMLRPVNP
jgi:hypothetical protein